jgi:hypothetical protein
MVVFGVEAGEGLGEGLAGAVSGDALMGSGGSVTEGGEQATVSPVSAANEMAPATASTEALGFIEESSWKMYLKNGYTALEDGDGRSLVVCAAF